MPIFTATKLHEGGDGAAARSRRAGWRLVVSLALPAFGASLLLFGGERFGLAAAVVLLSAASVAVACFLLREALRQAEAGLREREARLELFARHAGDLVLQFDAALVPTDIVGASRLLGYAAAELRGRALCRLVHSDDRELFRAATGEVVSGQRNRRSVTFRAQRRDGSWTWVELTLGRSGEQFVGTLRDVSDKLRSERKLHHSEARYKLLAENGTDLVVITDARGALSYVSPAVTRLLGYTVEQAMGLRTRDVLHPDESRDVPARIEAADENRAAVLTCRLLHRDGHYVWVEAAVRRIRRSGTIETVASIRDIGSRRLAEQRLADKTTFLEVTLESMEQGLLRMDRNMRVQVCNRRAYELLELSPEFMETKPTVGELYEYQRANGEFVTTEGGIANQIGSAELLRTNFVYERVRPNGTILEVRTVATPDGGALRTISDITERKVAERRIAHLARHDPLTDLPNRRLFQEQLERSLAELDPESGTLALLCLDLDGFKAVNDTLGHPAGDVLLHEVASRLRDVLSPHDVVARLGGDEFAIIQVGVPQPSGSDQLARRLIQAVNEPFDISGQPVGVGTSVGIALAPLDGHDPERLLRSADVALYRAKTQGRNVHRFFEPEMDRELQDRRALELDLKEALKREEFQLYYQPIYDVAKDRFSGCEALIRWNHPVRGFVPPSLFIPVAEEAQLIGQIGAWVLREACLQAATWPCDYKVAVNLSAAQFRSGTLVLEVASALANSGLRPDRLEVEITETVVMETASLELLHQLRALGIQIALDDFGTGYSSLSYLRQFPFDKIKIDRSFIAAIDDDDTAAIVRAIVGLGTRIGAEITAEGVETETQMERVRQEGCTQVQGYLLGRPEPAPAALRVMQASETQKAA